MKVNYNGIIFDSELEMNYWIYLTENKIKFLYQDKYRNKPIKINLGRRKNYVPDFIVWDEENKKIKIIELKGYAKWSANEDNNIMDFMKNKVVHDKEFLINWLIELDINICGYDIDYQRLKHLKGVGFVDYNYKNPNTLSNQRKNKILELEKELKESNIYIKNTERYFSYLRNIRDGKKLTKAQLEWKYNFEKENDLL